MNKKRGIPVVLTKYAVLAAEQLVALVGDQRDIRAAEDLSPLCIGTTVDREGEHSEPLLLGDGDEATRDAPDPDCDVDVVLRELADRGGADDGIHEDDEPTVVAATTQVEQVVGVERDHRVHVAYGRRELVVGILVADLDVARLDLHENTQTVLVGLIDELLEGRGVVGHVVPLTRLQVLGCSSGAPAARVSHAPVVADPVDIGLDHVDTECLDGRELDRGVDRVSDKLVPVQVEALGHESPLKKCEGRCQTNGRHMNLPKYSIKVNTKKYCILQFNSKGIYFPKTSNQ